MYSRPMPNDRAPSTRRARRPSSTPSGRHTVASVEDPVGAEIAERFSKIRCYERGDVRAPHKPLLLLLALARVQRRESRLMPYRALEPELRSLLEQFGPPTKQQAQPELPFWKLQNDDRLWEVDKRAELLELTRDRKKPDFIPAPLLRTQNPDAGFPPDLDAALRQRPALVNAIAQSILEANFPPSLHEGILDAVGFPWAPVPGPRHQRDPDFRRVVLRNYEYRCAVCGYDGRLGSSHLGIEAAHVQWHAFHGPDAPDNGIALCTFHHKALDLGAIGLDESRRILVSSEVNGSNEVNYLLLRHANRSLHPPLAGTAPPAIPHIQWHGREVFRKPARSST